MTVLGPAPTATSAPVLGVPCFVGSLTQAGQLIVDRARTGEGGYVCLANVHVLVTAQHDTELRRTLDGAWRVFPDGAPVAWTQRRIGHGYAERVGGPDLMALACAEGVAGKVRHFLLGSTEIVLDRLQRNLEHHFPGIAIVGSHSPSREDIEADVRVLVERISRRAPQIVWCALGAPRQEAWMARAAPELPSSLLVGVGAAFDFMAGTKPRAPRWMQRSGLEWAHRLRTEPRRLVGRYVRTNSEFILRAGLDLASARRSR